MIKSLSRKDNHRKSLMRNLATSLILYEEIKTTKAKAKALKPIVEHLIIRAKDNSLETRRRLLGYFFDKNATKKMLEVLIPRYKKVNSGFVRIYKIGPRLGDAAEMVLVKLDPGKIEKPSLAIKEEDAKEKSGKKDSAKVSPTKAGADKKTPAKGK